MLRRDEVASHVPGELHGGLEDALAGPREGHVRGQPDRRLREPFLAHGGAARLAGALDADARGEEPQRRPVLRDEAQQQVVRRHRLVPIPRASRCENTTAFTARSVNRSNTALTTTPRAARRAASRAADARIGRPAATATALPPPPAPAGENRRRRPAPVARMDADGTDDDEQQHASIALPRAAKLAPNSPHGV